MDLIPGLILFFGAIGTVALLSWDTFNNRKPITKANIQQSRGARTDKTQQKRRGLFSRG
tara:strand:+ start:135 stop:311 length:177 start_codon:yes stop_codon:yes gene_type:complete